MGTVARDPKIKDKDKIIQSLKEKHNQNQTQSTLLKRTKNQIQIQFYYSEN